jgi:hypothetical protein
MTTVALPMVHDSIPWQKKILLDLASIALYEIAWIQNIDRTDIVVLTGQIQFIGFLTLKDAL